MKKSYFIGGLVAVIAIVVIAIAALNLFKDSTNEQIMILEKEDHAIQFYMAEKETLFLRVTNNYDEPIYVKLNDITSDGKPVQLKGYSGYDYLEYEMERGAQEKWTNFEDTFNAISLTEFVGDNGTTVVDFGMLGDGQVYNLAKEEIKGTVQLYHVNDKTGEYTLFEEVEFTIPAEFDGQIF